MNEQRKKKKQRIEILKNILTEGPRKTEDLVNILIVNFAISKRTALEEINAVKFWMEEQNEDKGTEQKID